MAKSHPPPVSPSGQEMILEAFHRPLDGQGFAFYGGIPSLCLGQLAAETENGVFLFQVSYVSPAPSPTSEVSEYRRKGKPRTGVLDNGYKHSASFNCWNTCIASRGQLAVKSPLAPPIKCQGLQVVEDTLAMPLSPKELEGLVRAVRQE